MALIIQPFLRESSASANLSGDASSIRSLLCSDAVCSQLAAGHSPPQ